MDQKTFSLVAGLVFTIVALVHLLRLAQGWVIIIDGATIPMGVSWAGLVIAGILAFYGLRFGCNKGGLV